MERRSFLAVAVARLTDEQSRARVAGSPALRILVDPPLLRFSVLNRSLRSLRSLSGVRSIASLAQESPYDLQVPIHELRSSHVVALGKVCQLGRRP